MMHQPRLNENFGLVEFTLQFLLEKSLLGVTIIEARDLPPMDRDGKSDPFVEVVLRPRERKYKTTCKQNCLNPLFNESFDFPLTETELNDPSSELVLKIKDQDFASEELIGVVRLPLGLLDLSAKPKAYTCLIVNEVKKSNGSIDLHSAAKLNLKISDQTARIRLLESQLEDTRKQLDEVNKERDELCMKNIEHEMERGFSSDDSLEMETRGQYLSIDNVISAPISQRSSPARSPGPHARKRLSLCQGQPDDKRVFDLVGLMHKEIQKKDSRIAQLEHCIKEVNCHIIDAPLGQVSITNS